MNRILGSGSLVADGAPFVDVSGCSALEAPSACDVRRAIERVLGVGVGAFAVLLVVRFLVIVAVLVSGCADSVEDVGSSESRLSPLLPCTLGSQPFSPFWMLEVSPLPSTSVSLLRGAGGSRGSRGNGSVGVDVDLVSGGVSLLELE